MAKPAYRKASEWTGWWLGICLGGVAAQIGMLVYLSTSGLMNRLGGWAFLPGTLPLLVAIVLGWRVLAGFNRRRLAALAARLGPLGFHPTLKPSDAEKNAFAAPLLHLFPTLELQYGAARIEWFAAQTSGPAPARLFEHEYVTGSGKYAQVHHHTVIAWPNGHPDVADAALSAAPWFLAARYPWLARRAKAKQSLKNPAFADLAAVWTFHGDAATGIHFLTPRVRQELAHSPVGEEWSLGSGWVCCSFQGTLDAAGIESFLQHARAVLATS